MKTDTPLTDALMEKIGYADTFNDVLEHAKRMERGRNELWAAQEQYVAARLDYELSDSRDSKLLDEMQAAWENINEVLARYGK